MATQAAHSGAAARNHVTVVGQSAAPVVVFAHGFGCDQDMWRRVVPFFVHDYRVVLFDHVGAGRSDASAYERRKYTSLDGYARDLLDVCDEITPQPVTLVGHSVSAMVAVVAAVKEPSRFSRLILVAPSPCYIDDPSDGYVGGFSRQDIDGLLESLDNNYFAWTAAMAPVVMGNPQTPELGEELQDSFERTNPEIANEFARVTFLSDTRPLLGEVTTPSLILQCAQDVLAPVAVGHYLHGRLPQSTLVQLQATGHCPHVSAPNETAAAMLGYLDATQ